MRAVDELPLTLRQEAFGGILFAPQDAVHVELDRDAYELVRALLRGERQPVTPAERDLAARVEREIGGPLGRRAESVTFDRAITDYPFTVLNAPTLADFQITQRCTLGCPHCYAGSEPSGAEAGLADIERVCQQLGAVGVTQIALGGGEPLSHSRLPEILELCHQHNLVPNLTTNGLYLEGELLATLARWCGAVGLSLEGVGRRFEQRRGISFGFFEERLARLLAAGVPTVLQVTLSRENLCDLDSIVTYCRQQPRLYGVIFLAYKPVGRGRGYHHPLSAADAVAVSERLEEAFAILSQQMRVGYDCCLTPALAGLVEELALPPTDYLEGCSALRSSVGILPNLDLVPCTFTPERVIGNLSRQSLRQLWHVPAAHAFRANLRDHGESADRCRGCSTRAACLGGCPVFDLVGCKPAAG